MLLTMVQYDVQIWVQLVQVVGKMLGTIYRAMLTSRAATVHLQARKSSLQICSYGRIYQRTDVLNESLHRGGFIGLLNGRLTVFIASSL